MCRWVCDESWSADCCGCWSASGRGSARMPPNAATPTSFREQYGAVRRSWRRHAEQHRGCSAQGCCRRAFHAAGRPKVAVTLPCRRGRRRADGYVVSGHAQQANGCRRERAMPVTCDAVRTQRHLGDTRLGSSLGRIKQGVVNDSRCRRARWWVHDVSQPGCSLCADAAAVGRSSTINIDH